MLDIRQNFQKKMLDNLFDKKFVNMFEMMFDKK